MFRKILVLEILFLLYVINNISASFIISIQTDNLYNEDNETRNVSGIDDMFVHNLIGHASTNELETLYASSSFGKSHRFYYTLGERQDGKQLKIVKQNISFFTRVIIFPVGDKCIDQFAKTLQWKNETDAKLNIQYPRDGIKNDKKLTYVFVIVYQVMKLTYSQFISFCYVSYLKYFFVHFNY